MVVIPSLVTFSHPQATHEATSKMFSSEKPPKKSKKSKAQSTTLSEDEPLPIDILVDVIIGFLENASAFTRSAANESFSRVTSAVQGSTIDLILSVSEWMLSYFPKDLTDLPISNWNGGSQANWS